MGAWNKVKTAYGKIPGSTKAGLAGAGAGALTYGALGGIGVAAMGTAVGITLAPFACIGAGVGLVGYGCYQLGRKRLILSETRGKPGRWALHSYPNLMS